MPHLTYDGTARDTNTTPGVLKVGDRDGNTVKRVYVKPPVVDYVELGSKSLWGKEFPKGVAVQVSDPALVRKAMALGCFDFDGPAEWLEEKPKLRGRDARLARAAAAKAAALERTATAPAKVGAEQAVPFVVEPAPVSAVEPEAPKKRGRFGKKDSSEG